MKTGVFHIDRNEFFLRGLMSILIKHLPEIKVYTFIKEQALLDCLKEVIPELIIADLNALNRDYILGFYSNIKVLNPELSVGLLTMYPVGHPVIKEGLETEVFDFYLSKTASVNELVDAVSKIIQ